MKHRTLTVMILCLALLLAACQQVTPPATDGTTEPSAGNGDAHTHSYTAAEVVEVTCTEDGYTVMRCDCGVYYKSGYKKALGHDYKSQVIAPTATEKGYTLHTCKRCGHSYKDNEKDPVKPTSLLEVSQWLPEAKIPMSYDEFFSEDRALSYKTSNSRWLMPYGDGYTFFQVYAWNGKLAVTSQATDAVYPIPGLTAEDAHHVISTDGCFYYLGNETNICRVDMVFGKSTQLATFDKLHAARMYGDEILLYAATVDGISKLCRLYLPEMKLDVLYEGFDTRAPSNWFNFASSIKTNTSITWETLNPDFLDVLIAEINDPNSKYKNYCPELWANPDSLQSYIYFPTIAMEDIQNETGIKCQIRYTLNPSTGKITETLGIIDSCWHGSGYPHDHFDPNTYDIDPVWSVSDPVAVPNVVLPEDPEILMSEQSGGVSYRIVSIGGIRKLCRYNNDIFSPISDVAVADYAVTPHTILCATTGNTIIQMSPEGGILSTIYSAQYGGLSDLCFYKGTLYFMDGKYIMEMDLMNKTVRSLLQIPYGSLHSLYEYKGQLLLYAEAYKGLSVDGYEINIAEQTITENYHL